MDKAWYVSHLDVFEGISDNEMMGIAEQAVEHRCSTAKHVYGPHDGLDRQVFMLKEGEVILYHSEDGKRRIFDVLGPGSIFGNFFPSSPNVMHFAEAMPGSRYCVLSVADFQKVTAAHPEILTRLLYKLSERLHEYEEKLHADAKGAAERVYAALRNYQRKKRNPFSIFSKDHPIALSHEKLAELTGLNRVTVTRAIKLLKMRGDIVVDEKGLIVLP